MVVKLFARMGTGLLLLALAFSCATVPGLKDEASTTFIRVPFVRVLLDESQNAVTATAESQFAIECLQAGTQTVYYSTRAVTIRNKRRRLEVKDGRGMTLREELDEVNIIPRGAGNRFRFGDHSYRGILKLLPVGGNVQAINIVYMEDYLRGVVPPEIGPRSGSEIEAVKAQAVAARTYALSHLQQYPGERYDMKSSIIDQVYKGVRVENRLVNKAIDATAGQAILFEDKFINAYYHSTCGGMTDGIASVWDRQESPYLKSVEDSGACSWSKYYVWQEVFTEQQLRGRVEQYLSGDRGRDLKIGRIKDIRLAERTPGGRIVRMLVSTDKDVFRFRKDRIRWAIGRASDPDLILPSNRFEVVLDRARDGSLETVTFKGRGYGHGVGMCQCGAIGMAREGRSFDEIIRRYYTSVEIKKMY